MATAVATRSKNKKQEKTVLVLARYFNKATKVVSYHIRNGGGHEYCVTIQPDGRMACVHYGDEAESCEAMKYGRTCYHIKHCHELEQKRPASPISICVQGQEIRAGVVQYVSASQAIVLIDDQHYSAQQCDDGLWLLTPECEILYFDVQPPTQSEDPWEGFTEEQRFQAYREYEMQIGAL